MSIAQEIIAKTSDSVAQTLYEGYAVFEDNTMIVFDRPVDIQERRNAEGRLIYGGYRFADGSMIELRRNAHGELYSKALAAKPILN